MEKKGKKKNKNLFLKNFVSAAAILFIVNVVLGVFLVLEARSSVRKLNDERMLDVVNTAADMLDGDVLRDLKKEDANTAAYKGQIAVLTYFQNNIDLDYIYCIKPLGDGTFVFSIDSSVTDPGEFGAKIVVTDALIKASEGTPAVDKTPYTDQWGTFYSAYCPVFDSDGNVAVIVAVDLDAKTYEKPMLTNTLIVLGIIGLSLVGGGLFVYLITTRLRKRFNDLEENLSSLGENIEDLNDQITHTKNRPANYVQESEPDYSGKDEIGKLNAKIDVMQTNLERYMDYAYALAFTDSMTGVNNKSAYFEKVHALDRDIKERKAAFSVAVFDINNLKLMNDNFGHEHGDRVIVDSVRIISEVFGIDNVYRIGGDEFIVIADGATLGQMEELFRKTDARLEKFNAEERTYETVIGFAKGAAEYTPDLDADYKSVFKRADGLMFRDKETYHLGRCSLKKPIA